MGYLYEFILLVPALSLVACERGCGGPVAHDSLSAHVERAVFAVPNGSAYPEPERAGPDILREVEARYHVEVGVRNLLATYFLKFDAALLDRGLLSVSTDGDDLIAALWKQEGRRNGALNEWPSATLMREHIRLHSDWFGLSEEQKRVLATSEAKFRDLQATWGK